MKLQKALFVLACIVISSLFFFTSSAQAYRVSANADDWVLNTYSMSIPQDIFNRYEQDVTYAKKHNQKKTDKLIQWFWVGNKYNIPANFTCSIDTANKVCNVFAYHPENHYQVGLVLLDKNGNKIASYWFPVFNF